MDATRSGPARASGGPGTPVELTWRQPQGLFALSVINFVLRILTLGIYNFWGKTEVRKRIWSAIRLEGEPLQYTGTGLELFLGFLIVFLVFVLPILLISAGAVFVLGADSRALEAFQLLLYAGFFFLTGAAIFRAQRYRLSRTRWRGIRGNLAGHTGSYAWAYFWTGLMIPLTLGWIVPWRSTQLQGRLTRVMGFGNRRFAFSASSGPLYLRFTLFWIASALILAVTGLAITQAVASIPFTFITGADGPMAVPSLRLIAVVLAILGIAYILYSVAGAWYRAHQIRHFSAHTHFEGGQFRSEVTAGGLIWIGVSNFLIVVLTLGLLVPVAQARWARYLVENLEITGAVRLAGIAQGEDQGIRRGEGLAQAFDVDAF